MKLTVLGNNGPFPAAGGACSGYLLSEGETNVLLDCGNGVLANLQRFAAVSELDAVILTHLHSDHTSDMMVLRYAVQIKKKRGSFEGNIRVYAPSEPALEYERLDVRDAFTLEALTNDTELVFGKLRLSFRQMKHPSPDYAVSAECEGKRFVFSGDTSWTEEIIEFAKGADLLLLDAGLLERDRTGNDAHMTAGECGVAAKKAGAKRLLLTHFWPEYDKEELLAEARAEFKYTEASELLKVYRI